MTFEKALNILGKKQSKVLGMGGQKKLTASMIKGDIQPVNVLINYWIRTPFLRWDGLHILIFPVWRIKPRLTAKLQVTVKLMADRWR